MRVITESGAIYTIEGGRWRHNDDYLISLWEMKSVPKDAKTWDDIHSSTLLAPAIGFRMFISGKDEWRISTPVVSIEED